jgi:hypothetical protein
MSSAGIDQAIERIAADPQFATTVLSDRSALQSFELTDEERTSVVEALASDLEAAGYEVQPFGLESMSINWGDVQLNNTSALGRFPGTFDRSQNAAVLLEGPDEL